MYRSIANKNGTIAVNGNDFRFSQPIDEFKTEDMEEIETSYRKKLDYIADDPHYITAQDISYKHSHVIFEYDLTDLKMFDYLRTLFFDEKLYYYRSLIEIAKRDAANEINILWQKENFVVDTEEQTIKTMILEHDNFELHEKRDTVTVLKELIIMSLTSLNHVLGKPRRADFLEQKEEVIRFAEKMYLRAKTIEEIEENINAEIYRIEMEIKKAENAKPEGKLAAFRAKLESNKNSKQKKKESDVAKPKDKVILGSNKTAGAKRKNNDKKTVIGVLGVVAVAAVIGLGLTSINNNQSTVASAEIEGENEENTPSSEQLLSAYRDYFNNPSSTVETMNKIGYENLSEEDKNLFHQASFEVATDSGNWEQILELKDHMELTEQQINTVLTAFFNQEDVSGAEQFIETQENTTDAMQARIDEAKQAQEDINSIDTRLNDLEYKLSHADSASREEELNNRINALNENLETARDTLHSA